MDENGFVVLNGRFVNDYPAKFTHLSALGNSVIDLVWMDVLDLELVDNFNVLEDNIMSDHFPVKVDLNLLSLHEKLNKKGEHRPNNATKILKWIPDKANEYVRFLQGAEESFVNCETISIEEQANNLNRVILRAAESASMFSQPKSGGKKHYNKKWFDKECRELNNTRKMTLKKCRKSNYDYLDNIEYTNVNKKFKALIKNKKKQHYNEIKIKLSNVRNSTDFWATINSFRVRPHLPNEISPREWCEFYGNIFPPRVLINDCFTGVCDPLLDSEITFSEIENAIRHTKAKKAPGPDNIGNAFYKALPLDWILYLQTLFNNILCKETLPTSWSKVNMTMIYKKGDKKDRNNYRGIALINSITKIFTQVLKNRLEFKMEKEGVIPESQGGFRKNRGCLDNIFSILTTVQLNLRNKGRKCYAVFVDFRRAFDSISHEKLWRKLFQIGVSAKTVRILKKLYDNASLKVKTNDEFAENIEITEGVMQGEILSPLLFILFISDIEQYFRDKGFMGIPITHLVDLLILLYADDLVLFAYSLSDLRRKLKVLDEYCSENGLNINVNKTKIVEFKRGGNMQKIKKEKFLCHGVQLEIVESYVHLGVPITSSGLGWQATKEAIRKANLASGAVRSILLKSKNDSWETKCKLLSTLVESVLLYAFPAWGPAYIDQLDKVQLNFFKRTFCLPNNTPNHVLRVELGVPNTGVKALSLIIRWIIRTLSMEDNRLPKISLLRLIDLFKNKEDSVKQKYNWVCSVNTTLDKIGFSFLRKHLDSQIWAVNHDKMVEKYKQVLREQDFVDSVNSQSCLFKIPRSMQDGTAAYLLSREPFFVKKTLIQIRLANVYRCSVFCKNCKYVINQNEICTLCTNNELESLKHILCDCDIYVPLRNHYAQNWSANGRLNIANFTEWINSNDKKENLALYNYLINCLQLRAFLRNE